MALNCEAICEENRQRYGADIGRIGPMLLADRYDDRTHFIFELLQNAEDALGRRGSWSGHRRVSFNLSPARLTVSHFGPPFDDADVRGVCGIAQSTRTTFRSAVLASVGVAYWLYVVEHATETDRTRILRIQDPVAHARTFTFDRGWVEIARTDPPE